MCELASSENPQRMLFGRGPVLTNGVKSVLIVDDEEVIIEVTREMLEATGYRVYTASTGQEALDRYRREKDRIQMVILDMVMPGTDCGEMVEQLRIINPAVKIILSSGYGLNNEVKRIIAQGVDSFLPKPFRMEQLLKKISDVLESPQQ